MKRSLVSILVVTLFACGAMPPVNVVPTITLDKGSSKLIVHVEKAKVDKGPVICDLFNAEKDFPGASPIVDGTIRLEASANPLDCVFKGLPAGTFAISVIQDENNNGALDSNLFGVPTEGFGASNNILPATSAPTFADSKFAVDGSAPVELTVRLKN